MPVFDAVDPLIVDGALQSLALVKSEQRPGGDDAIGADLAGRYGDLADLIASDADYEAAQAEQNQQIQFSKPSPLVPRSDRGKAILLRSMCFHVYKANAAEVTRFGRERYRLECTDCKHRRYANKQELAQLYARRQTTGLEPRGR